MEVAWPRLGWLLGREAVSEDGDWEPLPGRRKASLSWLPGSRGWYLAKEVGPWVVGKLGAEEAALLQGRDFLSKQDSEAPGLGANAGTFGKACCPR